MHRVYVDREPEVVHGRHAEPALLVRLGGHPDERWHQVFMDPAFESGLRFAVELVGDALWITVDPAHVVAALDWLATRIEQVNVAADVREHRIVEHELERAVHDWWTAQQITTV